MIPVSMKVTSDVTISFPQDICCNCGATERLSRLTTPLNVVRYMIFAGTEITINPELPYCAACTKSAKRRPGGIMTKLLYGLLLAFLLGFAGTFVLPPSLAGEHIFIYSLVLALAILFGIETLKKPKGRQTSYYQPVRLKKVRQKFSGRITGFIFAFTNGAYERKFTEANRAAVSDGSIEVGRA